MPAIPPSAALLTLIPSLRRSANLGTTLIVSLLWIVYNMVPPYLLIHYTFIGRGTTLKFVSRCVPPPPDWCHI